PQRTYITLIKLERIKYPISFKTILEILFMPFSCIFNWLILVEIFFSFAEGIFELIDAQF
ncbi:TPA: hypothetical protein ACHKF5_005020, partial [Escherichia coli]